MAALPWHRGHLALIPALSGCISSGLQTLGVSHLTPIFSELKILILF